MRNRSPGYQAVQDLEEAAENRVAKLDPQDVPTTQTQSPPAVIVPQIMLVELGPKINGVDVSTGQKIAVQNLTPDLQKVISLTLDHVGSSQI